MAATVGDDDELDDLLNQAYPERAEKKVGGGGGTRGETGERGPVPGFDSRPLHQLLGCKFQNYKFGSFINQKKQKAI